MNRLLHAAARGAKMQTKWLDSGAQWQTTGQLVLVDDMRYYRIHPADEHLQYGPISTALRDMAEDDGTWRTDLRWNIAHIVANEFNDYYDWQCEPDYPLFYLFLAEFLADEGM